MQTRDISIASLHAKRPIFSSNKETAWLPSACSVPHTKQCIFMSSEIAHYVRHETRAHALMESLSLSVCNPCEDHFVESGRKG